MHLVILVQYSIKYLQLLKYYIWRPTCNPQLYNTQLKLQFLHFYSAPEQDERTSEKTEQWREFHYDGLDTSDEYNRHAV